MKQRDHILNCKFKNISNRIKLRQIVFNFFIFVSIFFVENVSASTFTDSECGGEFNNGTFTNMTCSGGNVYLNATGKTNGSGYFTSRIFQSLGEMNRYNTISWLSEQPYGKELVNFAQEEYGYPFGNVSMINNVYLLHFNYHTTMGEGIPWQGFFDQSTYSTSFASCYYTVNCPTEVAGVFSKAYSFDGANDYLVASSTPEIRVTGPMTLSAWIKQDTVRDQAQKMTIISTENGNAGYSLQTGAGKIVLVLGDGTSVHSLTASSTFTLGVWHHIAGTFDGQTMRVYLDGYLDGQQTEAEGFTLATSTTEIHFGTSAEDLTRNFDGAIDEVSIFSDDLTDESIYNMYLRSLFRLKFQVRFCDDPNCVGGEVFTGPDDTVNSYFEEMSVNSPSMVPQTLNPSYSIPYIQYKMILETSSSTMTPVVNSVTFTYNIFSSIPEFVGVTSIAGAVYAVYFVRKKKQNSIFKI